MRDIGRYLYFKPTEVEVSAVNEPAFEKQILVAGVGNAWLQDDAFGGEVRPPAGGERRALGRDRHGLRHRAASTSPTRSCAATTR